MTDKVDDTIMPLIWVEEVRLIMNKECRMKISLFLTRPLSLLCIPDSFQRKTQVARADEKSADLFKSKIQNKLVLGNALIISGIALGLGLFLIAVTILVLKAKRERSLKDPANDSKKSYSSLPQKEVPAS